MKRILLTTSLISLGFVSQAHAEDFASRVAEAMLANGYTDIEIVIDGNELTVEARRDDIEIETVYSTTTEEVLEHQTSYIDDDEDDEDDDEDNDDDDDQDDDDDDLDDHDDGPDHDDDDVEDDEEDDDDDGEDGEAGGDAGESETSDKT